jgi:hypothetical protein
MASTLHGVSTRAAIGSIIAERNAPMRHKIQLAKPFLDQTPLHNIPNSSKYAAKRRKTGTTVSASQTFPSVDDDSSVETAADSIQSFRCEEPSTNGQLIIAPLEAHEVGAASVVLTRAFATSPQGVPIEDGR